MDQLRDTPRLVVDTPQRPVEIQSGRRFSQLRTRCDVKGAICFNRSRSMGGNSRVLSLFQLASPTSLTPEIVAYGLDAPMLEHLWYDDEFRTAVTSLLSNGFRISLGGQQLELNRVGKVPAELRDYLSNHLSVVAARLEALTDGVVNSEASLARIRTPWLAASAVSIVAFFLGHLGAETSISAFSLLPAIVTGATLLFFVEFVILRASLSLYALAGAVVLETLLLSIFSSVFFSTAACIVLNDYVGAMLLLPTAINVKGVVRVTHGRGTHCSLVPDVSTPVIINGEQKNALPFSCSFMPVQVDVSPRRYHVEINPGLLGASFVMSLRADESAVGQ